MVHNPAQVRHDPLHGDPGSNCATPVPDACGASLAMWCGSDGIHPAYAAYFGPCPLFQPALSSLEPSSKKKCPNEMLDKIKAILRDT